MRVVLFTSGLPRPRQRADLKFVQLSLLPRFNDLGKYGTACIHCIVICFQCITLQRITINRPKTCTIAPSSKVQ